MSEWFTAKIKYLRQMDNGLIKQISEQYLVDSMSFTECEARVTAEVGEGMREVKMMAIAISNIKEVVFYGDTDIWFKTKVTYALMDEETEKEKKVTTYLLVNANDAREAYDRTEEHLKEMLVPFQIKKVEESPIIDVFQYQKSAPAGFKRVEKPDPTDGNPVPFDPQGDGIDDSESSDGDEECAMEGSAVETQTPPIDPTNGQAVGGDIHALLEEIGLGGLKMLEATEITARAEEAEYNSFWPWFTHKYPFIHEVDCKKIWDYCRQ